MTRTISGPRPKGEAGSDSCNATRRGTTGTITARASKEEEAIGKRVIASLGSLISPPKYTRVKFEEMEEEAILMAQAIQRVHHCTQRKGATCSIVRVG